VQAVNKVKIVTIGGTWLAITQESDRDYQRMVDSVIDYWKKELSKALIHKPDLILLTEDCDRPGGLNVQEKFEYYRIRKDKIQNYFSSVAKENRCYMVSVQYAKKTLFGGTHVLY